jgi:hypothetical protein
MTVSIYIIMTTSYATAVKALTNHRNRSTGFFSKRDAHLVFTKSFSHQEAQPSKDHSVVISKARKRRQSKGWGFIDSGDGWTGAEITSSTRHPKQAHPSRDDLEKEKWHIIVNK